jgi:DNA polymerase-3 subunit epsilon
VNELAEFTQPKVKRADLSGRLVYNDKNEIVFNFGKHKGERVIDNAQFTNWILSKDFPEDTKNILRGLTKSKQK